MKSVSVSMNREIVRTLHMVQYTDTQFMKRDARKLYSRAYRLVFMNPKAISLAPASSGHTCLSELPHTLSSPRATCACECASERAQCARETCAARLAPPATKLKNQGSTER
jgi:hypothetical protein